MLKGYNYSMLLDLLTLRILAGKEKKQPKFKKPSKLPNKHLKYGEFGLSFEEIDL